MAVELLVSLLKGAGALNSLRKVVFDASAVDRVADALAAVSQETAGRLFREAFSLPPKEQESTLQQVTGLLEVASTADDYAPKRRLWQLRRIKSVPDIQSGIERFLLLAFIYQLLGHHVKARHRVQHAKEKLPELKRAMELDVGAMAYFPRHRLCIDVPPRQEAQRKRHAATLAEVREVCTRLELPCH